MLKIDSAHVFIHSRIMGGLVNKKTSNIMGGLINFVLKTPLRLNEDDDANMMQGPNRRLYFNTSIGQIKRWGNTKTN